MRATVVPMTPLLLVGESGLADPLADLRKIAVETVADLADGLDSLSVLVPSAMLARPMPRSRAAGRTYRSLTQPSKVAWLSRRRSRKPMKPTACPSATARNGAASGSLTSASYLARWGSASASGSP